MGHAWVVSELGPAVSAGPSRALLTRGETTADLLQFWGLLGGK